MNSSEISRMAILEIEKRRLTAENQALNRKAEITAKLPQLAEIERALTQTASELSKAIISGKGGSSAEFAKIRDNSLQAQEMIRKILVSNGYPEDYLETKYTCPDCADTGFTENGRCKCFKALIKEISAKELNRTANMPYADFEHFRLDYYSGVVIDGVDCHEKMSQTLNFCIQYAANFSPISESILMIGRTGTGKTHLSLSIAKRVMEMGYTVVYGSVVNFLASIEKEHFGRVTDDSDTMSVLLDCDLLILDDLGSEHHTAFYESTLYNIINSRINMGKPVIISCNLSGGELSAVYNERIVSRLTCTYTILPFYGKDIRQQKMLEKGNYR